MALVFLLGLANLASKFWVWFNGKLDMSTKDTTHWHFTKPSWLVQSCRTSPLMSSGLRVDVSDDYDDVSIADCDSERRRPDVIVVIDWSVSRPNRTQKVLNYYQTTATFTHFFLPFHLPLFFRSFYFVFFYIPFILAFSLFRLPHLKNVLHKPFLCFYVLIPDSIPKPDTVTIVKNTSSHCILVCYVAITDRIWSSRSSQSSSKHGRTFYLTCR